MRPKQLAFALWLCGLASPAFGQGGPQNLKFESGTPGELPPGWFCPTLGFKACLTDKGVQKGKLCGELRPDGPGNSPFGNMMQSIDAAPYRQKRIRLRAAVRIKADDAKGAAQLWLREDRPGQQMGFFDNMGDRPIRGAGWDYYEIIGDIGNEALTLNFGLMALGGATAWIDDVSLEVVGDATPLITEPPRPLDERGLANLVAFTRVLGYVRFFHPSDEAAATDWDGFAVRGVREVESAASPAELAERLSKLFGPIAATVRITAAPMAEEDIKAPDGATRLLMYRHHGVGLSKGHGSSPVYSSTRASGTFDDGSIPTGFNDPRKPLVVELGGVSACIPLAVFADESGSLPRREAQPDQNQTAGGYSANDRGTRLADVALAWNVFQHFYPYFDVVKTNWMAALPEMLKRAATDAGERAFLNTLSALVAQLHDGHGGVTHSSETATHAPPLRLDWVENKLAVVYVDPELEQKFPLLKRGAVLEKIDGTRALEAIETAENFISAATPQWKRFKSVMRVLAGPANSTVEVTVADENGEPTPLKLERTVSVWQIREQRPDKIAELQPGVWYIDLEKLAAGDFSDELIAKLEHARGVVFDMRGYPGNSECWKVLGHLTSEPLTCAQWHIPNVTRPDHLDMKYDFSNWPIGPIEPRIKARVAFLTDGRAISAAETFMGIVENYRLGEVVGAATAGTNGNVNPFTLPGGYQVFWTGMRVLKHDGSQHHGVGIRPTVPCSRTIKGVAEGRDELLEKAIEVVTK